MAKHTGKPAPAEVMSGDDIKIPRSVGRPTLYSDDMARRILAEIAEGKSLRSVCRADDMPNAGSVFLWLREKEDFSKLYARACEERSEAMMEDMFDIADDGTNDWMTINGQRVTNREVIDRSKLRVDVRKWYASKLKPRKYGDKLDMTTNGKDLPTPIMPLVLAKITIDGKDGKLLGDPNNDEN